jgi:hypothetical protein
VQARFDLAFLRWCEEYGYIGFHGALAAASDALQENDAEVAVLFCRFARECLEVEAEWSRKISERREELSRSLGGDPKPAIWDHLKTGQ